MKQDTIKNIKKFEYKSNENEENINEKENFPENIPKIKANFLKKEPNAKNPIIYKCSDSQQDETNFVNNFPDKPDFFSVFF